MKNLKTVLCLSSALFMIPTAQAHWQANWLVGVSAGYAEREGNLNTTFDAFGPAGGAGNHAVISTDLEDSGFIGGIFGGYQVRCNEWLFGAELNVDFQDKGKDHGYAFVDGANIFGFNASARYKRETTIGLTARGGYEIAPYFLPYIRLGIETSRDKLSASFSSPSPTLAANNTVTMENSRRDYRFVGGVGVEMPFPMTMMAGASLRLEYDYHAKGKSSMASGQIANATLLPSLTVQTKQRENTGKVSLVWNFA